MKKKKMELIFILDKSGSMSGLEQDTIGGFNSMLKKQQDKKARVTTVLFDHNYTLLHDRFNIQDLKPLTKKEYFVEGSTALLDALGKTINKIKNVQKNRKKKSRKVLFVIITDGLENASVEYNSNEIKKMITTQTARHGWEFLFLGANIDALETAEKYGISRQKAATYQADKKGTALNFSGVSAAISEMSKSGIIPKTWKKDISRYHTQQCTH